MSANELNPSPPHHVQARRWWDDVGLFAHLDSIAPYQNPSGGIVAAVAVYGFTGAGQHFLCWQDTIEWFSSTLRGKGRGGIQAIASAIFRR